MFIKIYEARKLQLLPTSSQSTPPMSYIFIFIYISKSKICKLNIHSISTHKILKFCHVYKAFAAKFIHLCRRLMIFVMMEIYKCFCTKTCYRKSRLVFVAVGKKFPTYTYFNSAVCCVVRRFILQINWKKREYSSSWLFYSSWLSIRETTLWEIVLDMRRKCGTRSLWHIV